MRKIACFIISMLIFVNSFSETENSFGSCQALTGQETAKIISDIYSDGNKYLISKVFGKIAAEFSKNEEISIIIFRITSNVGSGLKVSDNPNDQNYFIVFPPETTWRFFSPDAITHKSIGTENYKIQAINDISGWVLVFARTPEGHYNFIKENCAN